MGRFGNYRGVGGRLALIFSRRGDLVFHANQYILHGEQGVGRGDLKATSGGGIDIFWNYTLFCEEVDVLHDWEDV